MKILIIHQVPYPKMQYHLGLDHQQHDITYIGYPARMADLPASLRAQRLLLNDGEDLADGVIRQTSPQDGYQAVLSLSEFGILQAYRVRQHLGVPGDDLAMLQRVRDKVAMKAALHGSGIDFPRFFPAQGLSAPDWQGQTVLKPGKAPPARASGSIRQWTRPGPRLLSCRMARTGSWKNTLKAASIMPMAWCKPASWSI
ncbi:Uncharacterised protein [Chromobacterium violaceum]|uniref:Uncharacterized protein n=1 Tax=Chromobacterium violaceum TaxID=536 RepID=A0A3S4LEW6_CHRVL|nr:Uncharacterised protein [Chromobacterium violaceum]